MQIWEPKVGQLDATVAGRTLQIYAVAFARDGTWLASGGPEGVQLWDMITRQRASLSDDARIWGKEATAVAITPDGSWLASASFDGTVRIWDSQTGDLRITLSGHTKAVYAVAIAPEVAGSPARAMTGRSASGIPKPATYAALSPATPASQPQWRSRRMGPGSPARIVGQCESGTAPSDSSTPYFVGHTRGVAAVAIAPDGTWLASASYDRTVRIWDSQTGDLRTTLTSHTREVTSVAIAPDSAWLASTTADGTLYVWELATADVVAIMRVDGRLDDCAWSPCGQILAAGGEGGMYLFTFKP